MVIILHSIFQFRDIECFLILYLLFLNISTKSEKIPHGKMPRGIAGGKMIVKATTLLLFILRFTSSRPE